MTSVYTVSLGAVSLYAIYSPSSGAPSYLFKPIPNTNYIYTLDPNTYLATLTLLSPNSFSNSDLITYYLAVTDDIPNTKTPGLTNDSSFKQAAYCVIGAATGISFFASGGQVTQGTGLDFTKNTYYNVAIQNSLSSRLATINGSTLINSNAGGGGVNSPGVMFPYIAANGVNTTTNTTVNFNYGTGLTYGQTNQVSTTYGSSGTSSPVGGAVILQWFWPPPITSEICFPAGTPVKTDQGLLPIEKLKPGINTINRNRIEHITRTITNDNYLVCFEKDSLDINLPIRRTLISKNHKILYKNKLIEAYKFINSFHGVHKVEYNGELLYNVLMEDYYTMDVNNLICETLHPTNVIAQIHNSSYSKEEKAKMLYHLKDLIKNKEKPFKKLGMPIGYKK